MKVLKTNNTKDLLNYLVKRLIGRRYKRFISPTSGDKTYYLKSDILGQRNIRISNHHLHEKQYKISQIDIVIENDLFVSINKIILQPHEIHSYRSVIAERIMKILDKKSFD